NNGKLYDPGVVSTKGTVQQFVDDFITSTLAVEQSTFPAPIKYLFDLLEEGAGQITSSPIPGFVSSKAWKNQQNFNFERRKKRSLSNSGLSVNGPNVHGCLFVKVNPNWPKIRRRTKLLFARDLPRYRAAFGRFYNDIRHLPTVTDQELNSLMAPLSSLYSQQWNTNGALRELFLYSLRYQDQILNDLRLNPVAQRQHLADRFEQVRTIQQRRMKCLWRGKVR
ncbi:putative plexin-B3, partial [Trichinella spiralis]|uniref:putative plexin-B3 n=1 Tax=Trichinella spiralis TaxID=6334 RepID=UPI0001EFE867